MTDRSDPGGRLIAGAIIGTALFAVSAVLAAMVGGWALWPAFVIALALFGIGVVLFVAAFATAVQRSRRDEMGIGGLFFLAGSATAPAPVKRRLLGALAVQIVVALATAAVRPFSTLAFGVLVPLFGVSLQGLWSARYGRFGPRVMVPARRPPQPGSSNSSGGEVGNNGGHG